jgi:hypothetical protein
MSQVRPNTPLFELGNDHITIDKLSVIKIGLGIRITAKVQNDASKTTCEILVNQN